MLVVILLSVLGCGSGNNKKIEKDTLNYSVKTQPEWTDNSSEQTNTAGHPILQTEDAETLIAKHYSALNQKAGFIYYKDLGISVISIKNIHPDSFNIEASVTGRKRKHAEKDTTTLPFSQKHFFKAFSTNGQWVAEFPEK